MDLKQLECLEYIKNGHHLLITGQAGTGKTFIISKLKALLPEKCMQITASTGIAATHYGSCGMTVHKISGIGDGRHSNSEILHLIKD